MSRRKYKTPKGYRDGGRVPVSDMPIADDAPPEHVETASPPDDAMLRAVRATQRADELSRAPPLQSDEDYIDSLPISEHKKDFLRQWPDMLKARHAAVMKRSYDAALAQGIPDDTADMDKFLLDAVNDAALQIDAKMPHNAAAMAFPQPRERSIDEHAQQLADDASVYQMQSEAMHSIPTALDVPLAPPPRRSVPFAAPVSRDAPTASGQRHSESSKITLTAEERDIARRSIIDPTMSDEEKELSYARNKRRLQLERASGRYPMPEKN